MARERVKFAYDHTISTRLNHPKHSAIICVMQRLHADDLAGHMLEQEEWDVIRIPAAALTRERWDLGHTAGSRLERPATLSSLSGLAMKSSPSSDASSVTPPLKRNTSSSLFPRMASLSSRRGCGTSSSRPNRLISHLVSWDTASTLSEDADWSVGTVWALSGSEIHLLHVERLRVEAPDLRHRIEQMHIDWKADLTVIEEADLGRGITQDLRRTSAFCKPQLRRPRIEKLARMQARSVMFETGRIYLPREAPWLST